MRHFLLLPLIASVLIAIAIAMVLACRRLNHPRLRISLRGLFLAVALVAVVMASISSYRRAVMAQLKWIPVSSQESIDVFPTESVTVDADGNFRFTYYAKRKSIQQLLNVFTGDYTFRVDRETVRATTNNEPSAQKFLKDLHDNDTLATGEFVIRGKIVNSDGKPIAGATIDLLGPYVFINHFQTRDDGTFTMPLKDGPSCAPAGSGYYLRIRSREETGSKNIRWNTNSFSLDIDRPEIVARITIPQ